MNGDKLNQNEYGEEDINPPANEVDVFEVEHLGDTVVLTPTEDMGELSSQKVADELHNVREELEDKKFKNVVLDFERTDYFGSTVLNQFIHLWKDVRDREGQMAFCAVAS